MTSPQLDPHTRDALRALDQPPPGVEARLFAAILQQTTGGGDGGGGDGGGFGGGGFGGESALAYAAKVVGATLGLTAAGFALVAASAYGVRSLRATPEPTAAAIMSPGDISGPGTDSAAPITTASDPEPVPTSDPPEPASAPLGPASAPAREPSGVAKSSPATSPAPTLEAELALLETARRAAPQAALVALERHRIEFEHGVLADEREVLRVETSCALGRVSEAQVIASTFLATRPSSPLRSRIEAACEGKLQTASPS